jgi:uncharacterized protein (TIGR00255 family)
MLLSMTGFASKTAVLSLEDGSKVNVSINLKSLNSRFFELTCKVPYALSQLETDFIRILKKKLHRGHVSITMHINNMDVLKGSVEPSMNTVKGYLSATNKIKDAFNLSGELSLGSLLALPDVFNIQDKSIDEQFKTFIFTMFDELVNDLRAAQKKEGDNLKHDLIGRLTTMRQEITTIETEAARVMEKHKAKISESIKELAAQTGEASDTFRSTLYTMIDKVDIHEEIVRFNSHLKNLSSIVESSKEEKGKLLDFTLQELAREVNTIAAKCADATISGLAINIKVELEKAREQAQNIV